LCFAPVSKKRDLDASQGFAADHIDDLAPDFSSMDGKRGEEYEERETKGIPVSTEEMGPGVINSSALFRATG